MARSRRGPENLCSEPCFKFCGDTIRRAVIRTRRFTALPEMASEADFRHRPERGVRGPLDRGAPEGLGPRSVRTWISNALRRSGRAVFRAIGDFAPLPARQVRGWVVQPLPNADEARVE